jgi:hypothetical protein
MDKKNFLPLHYLFALSVVLEHPKRDFLTLPPVIKVCAGIHALAMIHQ